MVDIQEKLVPRLGGGYRWTQQGVQFSMTKKPGTDVVHTLGYNRSRISLPLNCWKYNMEGKLMTVVLELVRTGDGCKRERCDLLLLKKRAKASSNTAMGFD